MSRAVKIVIALALLFLLFGLFMYVRTVRYGFSTHDEPGSLEAFMARTTRALAVPSDLRNKKNPLPLTPAILAEGRAHWADHCALCHGNDGKGTELGKGMYPNVPDMTSERVQELSDGALFATIENGIRLTGMPGFGSGTAQSAYGTWGLVHFIRHLPKLTPEEMSEMQKLNPKTPEEFRQMQEEEAFLGDEGEAPTAAPAHDAQPHQH